MSQKIKVNGLWLGKGGLKQMEYLTLKSFTANGAEFHLWHYGDVQSEVPKGVVLRDGNELIPQDKIFRYPTKMLLGFGENSYVGFSEIFRYKVLWELGGWWSDMDVVCLKPLEEIEDEYWFRFHGVLSVVGNIMKCPPKSELMKFCYEKALKEVNENQNDWHHAIRILCYYIEFFGLSKYIHYDECNLDRLNQVIPLIEEQAQSWMVPDTWKFIHWMNSVVPKEYKPDSVMDRLYKKHQIYTRQILL
jgi:hypothetical protein